MKILKLFIIIALTGFFSSCSVTRHLEEDQLLYNKTEIKFSDNKFLKNKGLEKDLKNAAVPEPNDEFLGFIPFKLWMYNLAGDSVPDQGFKNWLKYKVGEEPVIYRNYHKEASLEKMSSILYGKGYFNSRIDARELVDDQKITLQYNVALNQRYEIDTIIYQKDQDSITIPFDQYRENSLLKKNDDYDIETLRKERERIAENLRNDGYYFFTSNNLIFKIDSNRVDKNMKLFVALKENIPDRDMHKYRINQIRVYPDFDLASENKNYDTTIVDSMIFLSETHRVDRDVINKSIMLRKGDVFSTIDYSATLNKLMGLGIFKYANVSFNRDTSMVADSSHFLNMDIYLTQTIPVSARIELQMVTKSTDYTGPYLYLTYLDRNAFGGAERFEMNLNGGFESQLTKKNNMISYEVGSDFILSFPRFIFPFIDFNKYLSQNYTPQTEIRLGYDIVSRVSYFTSNSLETSYGYNWQETESKFHNFKLFALNYSNLLRTTTEFDTILEQNPLLAESFDEKMILSIIYDYTYDELKKEDDDFTTFFNLNTELSGNTLSLLDNIVYSINQNTTPGEILGLKYTQFAKATTDFRFTYFLDEDVQIVNRYIIGAGLPYGNSKTLPYNKQYFIGGVNSLRGFPYRSVGPGSFQPEDEDRFLFSHNGNFKLETNLELRFPIAGPVNGAIFADLGNIWMWEETTEKPGSKFRFSEFTKQLAFNTGFGIRFDISFFVLRLDLGIPLRRPYRENGSYWIGFKPFNKEWISTYPVLNFAIGYPF